MSTHNTVAVGPNGPEDYRKLVVDAQNRLKAVIDGAIQGSVTFQGLSTEGKVTLVNLTATAWTALPATALANRNSIVFQNQSDNGKAILLNYTNSAPANEGIRIEDGGFRSLAIRPGIIVYGRMTTGTGVCAVEELA